MRSSPSSQLIGRNRRGISVLWVILALPTLLVALCLIVDFANLWTARSELEAALEAAAIAGVDAWADESRADDHADPDGPAVDATGGTPLKTDIAREAARAAAAANFVRGVSVALDLNDNGTLPHDNADCAGDILLGGYDDANFTFETSADVGCGRTTVTVVEAFLTINRASTGPSIPFVETSDTASDPNAFRISLFNTAGEAAFAGSVTRVIVELQNAPNDFFVDDGVFDPFVAGTPGEADGFGPVLGTGNEVTTATFDTSQAANGVLVVNIPAGDFTTAGTENDLVFGIDTDGVGAGSPAASPADSGGDFGDNGAASTRVGRVKITLELTLGAGTTNVEIQSLQANGATRARLIGAAFNQQGRVQVVQIVDNEDFAVLARATVRVDSLWNRVFGLPVGPYLVSARAVATSKCRNQNATDPEVRNPQLVHVPVGNVICPGP